MLARPYAGEDDYAQMRQLLIETYRIGGPPEYCTIGDLDWWRCTNEDPHAITRAQLWHNEQGELIGFAWPDDDQVDIIAHPQQRAAEEAMLAWAEQQHARAAGDSAPAPFRAWSFTGDAARIALLAQRGYQRGDEYQIGHSSALDEPMEPPRLPPGYSLRHVAGEADLEPRVAVHRDAFAPSKMTVAKHRAVLRAPTYRPELDLIVVAPDGSFAAYCIVWFDAANQSGLFEPMGCHSAHRRRGLGMAALHEGMRRLQALGARTACVNSAGSDSAGALLYRAAGFHEIDRNYAWEKTL